MREVVLLDALRSPIGRHRGALASVRADDLAAHVIRELLARNEDARASVSEVIFGATNQAGEDNRNVARMAALLADLPYEVTGVTVNRLCGSGLEAVIQAARAIRLGEHEVMIAGGVESMTRAPFVMPRPEEPFPRTVPPVYDTSLGWRFPNERLAARFPLLSMGETAEEVARERNVSRLDQDAFALESHRRAANATGSGRFAGEIAAIELGAGNDRLDRDEGIRADTSLEKLARLRPVFRSGGTVTAGNSSPLNDGAAAVIVASADWARAHQRTPMARIVASASAGVHPNLMGLGPVPATRLVLERASLRVTDLDVVELNEAFAAQALACIRELDLDPARVNPNGGAIALGHPIGCSGTRIVVTLAHELQRTSAGAGAGRCVRGLATLCIGVGQGLALLLERS